MIQAIYSQAFLNDWVLSPVARWFCQIVFPWFLDQGWLRRDFLSGSQAKVRV